MINKHKLLVVAMCVLATGAFARAQDDQKQSTQPAVQSTVAESNPVASLSDSAQPASKSAQPTTRSSPTYPDTAGYKMSWASAKGNKATRIRQYNSLGPWDWDAIHLPNAAETFDPELGGLRAVLASHHMSYVMFEFGNFDYELNHPPMYGAQGPIAGGGYGPNSLANGPLATQGYSGQKATLETEPQAFLTYVIPRTNTQFVLACIDSYTTYEAGSGFTNLRMNGLYVNQMFYHNKLKLMVGYMISGAEVLGIYTGGNMAGSLLGVVAILPTVAGQNVPGDLTPNSNIRFNFTNHFYSVIGVQRSLSPYERSLAHHEDGVGLRFRIPYAKAFDELELGYNRAASPGVHRLWIRLDGFFNSSHFFDYRKGVAAMMTAQTLRSNNTDNNWALSDGIDYQVTQPDSTRPRRGLYEGFTVQYDPPQQNLFTNYFELRSYYIGPFARRPNDMLTVMINNIEFSKLGVGVLEQIPVFFSGGHAPASTGNHTQGNYGVSWIAHIKSGMSMNAGVEYTVHTMVTPQAPNSIVGSVGLGLIF